MHRVKIIYFWNKIVKWKGTCNVLCIKSAKTILIITNIYNPIVL